MAKLIEYPESGEVMDAYQDKFGEGLPMYGLDEEGRQLVLQMAKDAIAGKRGLITHKDLGISSESDV